MTKTRNKLRSIRKQMRIIFCGMLPMLVILADPLFGQQAKKPNVIYVFADQWRAQATGFSGDRNARTPALDKLAGESIVFTTAVSHTPVCSPYRASLLTGQYSWTNGIFLNDVQLNPEATTMGKIFKSEGFNTAYIGKWHLNGSGRSSYIPPHERQGFDYWKVLECTHLYNDSKYFNNDDTVASKWPGYDALHQTLDAKKYILDNASADKPFLLVLSWGPPHDPYHTAPQEYRDYYKDKEIHLRPNVPEGSKEIATKNLRGYYAHIKALDDCLSMLLQAVEQAGIKDETIFVFTSDHGDMMYSHNEMYKQQPFDESILVPFVVRYPKIHGNDQRKIAEPINTPDILPTLLGLCDIPVPPAVEGTNFAKAIQTNRKIKEIPALIASVSPYANFARTKGGYEYRGIRTSRYTYVRKFKQAFMLFDNANDPFQLNNLCGNPEYAKIEKKLDILLKKRLKASNDSFLHGDEYLKKWGYVTDETGAVPYTW